MKTRRSGTTIRVCCQAFLRPSRLCLADAVFASRRPLLLFALFSLLLLAALGSLWKITISAGCSWSFLAALGCSWLLLAVPAWILAAPGYW